MMRLLGAIVFSALTALTTACGGGASSGDPTPVIPNEQPDPDPNADPNAGRDVVATDDAYAYRRDSAFADVLKTCMLIESSEDSCGLNVLPLIGQLQDNPGADVPTVDQVMDRVLVTHDWMGARFEASLLALPELARIDILRLFSSTAGILFGSEVRPSVYRTQNAGIQIDPNYLWLTNDEKLTISIDDDPRAGNGPDLRFWDLRRWQIGDNRAWPFGSLYDDNERELEDIVLPLARLLFHELSHATDFLPLHVLPGLSSDRTVLEAIVDNRDEWLSPRLWSETPLVSDELLAMGQVMYFGEEATDVQNSLFADSVGALFGNEGAIQMYAYSTLREDFATLTTGVYMKFHFNADLNHGFVNKPADLDNYACGDLIVDAGERNRLGNTLVRDRARRSLDLIYSGESDTAQGFWAELADAVPMRLGQSWCANFIEDPQAPPPANQPRSSSAVVRAADGSIDYLVNRSAGNSDLPSVRDMARERQMEYLHQQIISR